ncbi:hypothetical protein BDZ85DRAFT_275619 [Elsinoe ampelina]|uniref:ER-bound oxygenase mpaB/mpaB'/Rubber oxygenase catalytic domain-containing protein n=1 Tax=Elsinoe ampelina TaxID=302913 RepID=A0A6A6G4P6_9PEZI|nr:hypothetical protein BDZ85DRAFT_275619 [Elsinoe ampelina]
MSVTLPLPLSILLPLVAAAYLLLQRTLRFRRLHALQSQYPPSSFPNMTLTEAYNIHYSLTALEFPTTFSQSVFFALFKTYGIPTISSLLLHTSELSGPTASKRAADTGVLLTEIFLNPPGSDRAKRAMGRMNYLHSRWQKAGKISNEDMLYTLSLFALEPARWVSRYEWRPLSDVEQNARGIYWRWVGEGMGIDMSPLLHHSTPNKLPDATPLPQNKPPSWPHGLAWMRSLETWSLSYEESHMLPAPSNRSVATGTVGILLTNVPPSLHSAADQAIRVLMEPRLRRSMMYPDPSPLASRLVLGILALRKWILLHLALPRPWVLRWKWFDPQEDAEGRIHARQFTAHPWYVRPSTGWRWGVKGLLLRLAGGVVPGDEGGRYLPQGYRIEDVGPERQVGRGKEEMSREVESSGYFDFPSTTKPIAYMSALPFLPFRRTSGFRD